MGVMSKNKFPAMKPLNRPRFLGFYSTEQAVPWRWGVSLWFEFILCISRWAVLPAWLLVHKYGPTDLIHCDSGPEVLRPFGL